MIRLENLRLGYGPRLLVEQASAALPAGSLTALLGCNGSGKSTLLRALIGQEKPQAGSIRLNGQPLSRLTPETMARTVAFVNTERVRVANLRCKDVVALGRAPYTNWIGRMQAQDETVVYQTLEQTGMTDYAERTMDRMSDGECQRIMIARALAQQTPIILLDEPTSFLDLPNRYGLGKLLAQLAHEQNKCIFFSTHELDIALSLCDAVALIDRPVLHYRPTADLIQSGLLDKVFGDSLRLNGNLSVNGNGGLSPKPIAR